MSRFPLKSIRTLEVISDLLYDYLLWFTGPWSAPGHYRKIMPYNWPIRKARYISYKHKPYNEEIVSRFASIGICLLVAFAVIFMTKARLITAMINQSLQNVLSSLIHKYKSSYHYKMLLKWIHSKRLYQVLLTLNGFLSPCHVSRKIALLQWL